MGKEKKGGKGKEGVRGIKEKREGREGKGRRRKAAGWGYSPYRSWFASGAGACIE